MGCLLLWRRRWRLMGQIHLIRQRLANGSQQAFFVEGLEQARDRMRVTHQFPGLRIVAAADQDGRQAPSGLSKFAAQFDAGH